MIRVSSSLHANLRRLATICLMALADCDAPSSDHGSADLSGDAADEVSGTDAGAQDAGSPMDSGPGTSDAGAPTSMDAGSSGGGGGGIVFVTLFTHIEDNTPPGPIGSPPNREFYLGLRARLIEVAQRAQALGLPFVLQPDWKILEASLQYEDGSLLDSSNGKNLYRYLHEDLGVTIDPHSHENGGYNYSDVAFLLEQLGVGGSTVIGGHIWDPSLASFQDWDRFRAPQPGLRNPSFLWRGDVLIGAATPNHVNDPLASGVWRPLDRDHFFIDDPAGNIVSVGAWANGIDGVEELVALYASGAVPPTTLLTAHWNINPTEYNIPGGAEAVAAAHFEPVAALVQQGGVRVVDFQTLVATWTSEYDAAPGPYMP